MSQVSGCENGRVWPGDPLDAARVAFGWLCAGPDPVALDCRGIEGLPQRGVPVDEVGRLLLRRSCPRRVWDQVWSRVIVNARERGETWAVVAVGLALPMLTTVAGELTARYADDPADVHAEVLRGFLEALRTVDVDRGRVVIRLRWAAYRAGHQAVAAALDAPAPRSPRSFDSAAPARPGGHPDVVLARAVRAGVLSRTEAGLIGDTRLDEVGLAEWAAARRLPYGMVQRARHRAERRLVAWLGESMVGLDDDPTTAAAVVELTPAVAGGRWSPPGAEVSDRAV